MTRSDADLPGPAASIDSQWYRQVLGQYPTGVCVVTARDTNSAPVAMIVGSFTSVSLDPPLVAFFPDKRSSSWAKLRDCAHFCVNILGADQEPICRQLASKDPDKFTGIPHRLSARGNPIVDGAVAWIECDRYSVTDAGDHDMVTGRILELDVAAAGLPLLFFQGGYGRFAPASIGVEGQGLTLSQLRDVDRARLEMEPLSENLGARCIATLRVADELVVAASAGQARRGGTATLVGQRLPFAPPTGAVFAAWLPGDELQRWLQRHSPAGRISITAAALAAVRRRFFSVGLLNDAQRAFSEHLSALAEGTARHDDLEGLLDALAYDPVELTSEQYRAVRVISAPVFDSQGNVALALTLHDFPKPAETDGVVAYIDQVVAAAAAVTEKLGGRRPDDA